MLPTYKPRGCGLKFTPIPQELASKVTITRFATIDDADLDGLRVEQRVLREAGVIDRLLEVQEMIYSWRKP